MGYLSAWWIELVGLYPYLGIEIAIWMLYALGFNLLLGFTGLPSFGHGAFLGSAPMRSGSAARRALRACRWASLSAVLAAAVGRALVACFMSHRRGIYFAFMTIAFGQVFWFVAIKAALRSPAARTGLLGIPRPPLVSGSRLDRQPPTSTASSLAVLLASRSCCSGGWSIRRSARSWRRSARTRPGPRFVGYRVWLFKWLVFTLSGRHRGLAGACSPWPSRVPIPT